MSAISSRLRYALCVRTLNIGSDCRVTDKMSTFDRQAGQVEVLYM